MANYSVIDNLGNTLVVNSDRINMVSLYQGTYFVYYYDLVSADGLSKLIYIRENQGFLDGILGTPGYTDLRASVNEGYIVNLNNVRYVGQVSGLMILYFAPGDPYYCKLTNAGKIAIVNSLLGQYPSIGATGVPSWATPIVSGTPGQTGPTGLTGNIGNTGSTGNQGNTGTTGTTGNKGNTGATGNQGNSGITGTLGNKGNTGPTGYTGDTGNSGSTGDQGNSGSTGSVGLTGNSGGTGLTGKTGYSGGTGLTGLTGMSGSTGGTGLTGLTGNSGSTGSVGLTGNSGSTGSVGLTGNSGGTGLTGLTGNSGATGNQGNSGSTGATGPASTVVGNTGTTGSTGTPGTYTETQNTLLGRGSVSGTGAPQEITIGSGLLLTGTTLESVALSQGVVTAPSITNNGTGSLIVGDGGMYALNRSADGSAKSSVFSIAGGTFAMVDGANNFIVADYNSGSPVIRSTTDPFQINETTVIPVYQAYRNGIILHPVDWDTLGLALTNKIHQSIVRTQPFRLESGLALGEVATRTITITAGAMWTGAVRHILDALNSSTDPTYFCYHSAGVWTYAFVTQYNNTQYDNGTNLVSLAPNKYAVNYVYRGVEDYKHCYITLGTAVYGTPTEAALAQPQPPPPIITSHAVLIGRIIVETSASTATQIDSAFATTMISATSNVHNSLSGLQGGQASEYFHLTSAQFTNATQIASSSQTGLLSATDWANTVHLSGTETVTGVKTFGNTFYQSLGYGYLGNYNSGGIRPRSGNDLAVAWNYSNGGREMSFWNTDVADSGSSFIFRQLTGTGTTHTDVLTVSYTGAVTATSFNSITGLGAASPLMNSSVSVGTSTLVSRQDHVHPVDTSRASSTATTTIGSTTVTLGSTQSSLTGLTSVGATTFTGGLSGNATTSTTATNLASGAVGSVPYQTGSGATSFLSGNTSTTPQFVTSTGTGSAAQAPTLTSSTGSGSVVLSTSPTLTTPSIGVATGTSFNSITGLASANPLMNSTVAVGTSTLAARQDHVHPVDTSRAAAGQTMYIGTTAVAINRASASLALTGTSVDGTAYNITQYTVNQSVGTGNAVSFDTVAATNNGAGTNFKIGDDVWLGDINLGNTFSVRGVANAANGYVVFGNGDSTALGRAGTGALTYGGNTIYHAGNIPTWNQSTTGTATNATNARNVYNNGTYGGTVGNVEPSSLYVYYAALGRQIYDDGNYTGNGTAAGWKNADQLGVRYAAYAGSAGAVTWTNVSGKPILVTAQDGSRYSTDFNTILTSGFYNADALPTNCPGYYGQLICARGVDTGLQIYGGYNNDTLWFRGWASSGASFYAWRSVVHSGNIGTQTVAYASSETLATVTNRGASTTGSITVNGELTVGNTIYSYINMIDSDEGSRSIHCNSNRIGFLAQAGGWGAWCDDAGNWYANNLSGTNTGDQTNISGNSGTTSQRTFGRVTTDGITQGSYGAISISGNSGGYAGINFSDYYVTMMINRTYQGFYRDNGTWDWGFANGVLTWGSVPGSMVTGTVPAASRATRGNPNLYVDDNYGNGIIGAYTYTTSSMVYAMGGGFEMNANGTTGANFYGIARSYENYQYGKSGLGHHYAIVQANAVICAMGTGIWTDGAITATGNITAYSDEKLKTNWRNLPENFVEMLAEVKNGIYDRIDKEDVTQVGVSAQSLQIIMPDAVVEDKDAGILSVSYGNAALAAAVELAKEVQKLKARIAELEARI